MVSLNDDEREARGSADEPEEAGAPAFLSEESPGNASPGRDLAAAACVGVLAVFAILLALLMPNPGESFFTAPGFMPFLTGFSLLVMTIGLGAGALKRGAWKGARPAPGARVRRYFADYENQWAIILMGVVLLYALLIDWVTFEVAVPLGIAGWRVGFSSFEAVTIPALAVVLRIFWPKPFLRCLVVSLVSTMVLAAAFRYGFGIPLPGSG